MTGPTPAEPRIKGARSLILLASLIVVIAGIKAAAKLILPFLISIFLAMISLPLLNWLRQRLHVPSPLAVMITILVVISLLAGIGVTIGGSIGDFTAAAPRYQARLEQMVDDLRAWVEARGVDLPDEFDLNLINPSQIMNVITLTLRAAAAVLSNLALVLITIVFILFEAGGFPDKLQAAFGDRAGSDRVEKIKSEVQRYLAIKTVISLTTGVIVGTAMAIIGVDFPILWGALAFLLNYVPNLGSIIAAIPPVLTAAVQLGPGHALAVALVFLAVNLTLGSLVEPYFMGRRLGLSTLVVFLSLVFWGWVWGPVGMFLSVPLTMIVKIMMENTDDLRWIAILLDANPRGEAAAPRPSGPS